MISPTLESKGDPTHPRIFRDGHLVACSRAPAEKHSSQSYVSISRGRQARAPAVKEVACNWSTPIHQSDARLGGWVEEWFILAGVAGYVVADSAQGAHRCPECDCLPHAHSAQRAAGIFCVERSDAPPFVYTVSLRHVIILCCARAPHIVPPSAYSLPDPDGKYLAIRTLVVTVG